MSAAVLLLFVSKDKVVRVCVLAAALIVIIPMLVVLTITQVGAQVVSDILLPQGANNNPTTIATLYGAIHLELPAVWPLKSGVITQEFGHANPPFQLAHSGMDIASYEGDLVRAILPGKVTFAGTALISRNIEVHVNYGQGLEVWYAHLNQVTVQEGQEVVQGQLVGYEGHTGWATGTHLHLEIQLYHIPVNPRNLLGAGNP
jgi:murein DD-endopeptidase MepM/ murein hydrolase activator NlpD